MSARRCRFAAHFPVTMYGLRSKWAGGSSRKLSGRCCLASIDVWKHPDYLGSAVICHGSLEANGDAKIRLVMHSRRSSLAKQSHHSMPATYAPALREPG